MPGQGWSEAGGRRFYRVTTPEGLVLPFRLASLGDRAGAFLIDLLVVFGAIVVLWVAAALAAAGGAAGLGMAVAIVAGFVLRSFYFALCEVNWGGRTLGKRLLGLRVIARDGGPLTAEAVMARNLMREAELFLPATVLVAAPFLAEQMRIPGWAIAAASAWLFVFALLPVFSRERLRCGDLVAGTLVVESPRAVLLPDLAAEPAARSGAGVVGAGAAARSGAGAAAGGAAGPAALHAAAATAEGVEDGSERSDRAAAHRDGSIRNSPGPKHSPTPQERSPAANPGRGAEFVFSREQLDIYGIRELQVLEGLLRRHAEGTLSAAMLEEVAQRIKTKIGWAREPGAGTVWEVPAPPFLQAFYLAQRARLEQKLLFGQRQEEKREG
jgi:uncharacterized RDD family membrane protein YckC